MIATLYAADKWTPRPTRVDNPRISLLACAECGARYYGQPVLASPTCPRCRGGSLRIVRTWDLRFEPLWPVVGRQP